MRKNGCPDATSIHDLIYRQVGEPCPYCGERNFPEDRECAAYHELLDPPPELRFVLNENSRAQNASCVIVDEISMVDEKTTNDLLSFGRPIIVVGDPFQLPPVHGKPGYFMAEKPDAMLTEIHRQRRDDPIIHLATTVRNGGKLALGKYGESLVTDEWTMDANAQTLCGIHTTRWKMNANHGQLRGWSIQWQFVAGQTSYRNRLTRQHSTGASQRRRQSCCRGYNAQRIFHKPQGQPGRLRMA